MEFHLFGINLFCFCETNHLAIKQHKELTVKGLEMEINKMTSNHQKEITELKRIHQQELLDTAEEARLKYERNEKTIRDSLTEDREAAIEKERAIIRERYVFQYENLRYIRKIENE